MNLKALFTKKEQGLIAFDISDTSLEAVQLLGVPAGKEFEVQAWGRTRIQSGSLVHGVIKKQKEVEVKTINAPETDLINCDKNSFFDIYCGKSKKPQRTAKIEVWIDTSTSLKNID